MYLIQLNPTNIYWINIQCIVLFQIITLFCRHFINIILIYIHRTFQEDLVDLFDQIDRIVVSTVEIQG